MTPSWYGDSVGHYEGDELLIDTVGIKIGRFSMVDWFGTPYTEALHLVERYRLLDYEATMKAVELAAKEHAQSENPGSGPRANVSVPDNAWQVVATDEPYPPGPTNYFLYLDILTQPHSGGLAGMTSGTLSSATVGAPKVQRTDRGGELNAD